MKKHLITNLLLITIFLCITIIVLSSCKAEPHVHSFGDWTTTKQATCTEPGEQERLCSCGEKQTQPIPANGHSFGDWNISKAPTCTEPGEQERLCSCGEKQTSSIPAKGHSFGDWITSKESTCTEPGEEVRSCSNCETTQKRTLSPKGHSWGQWTTTKQITCTETGEQERSCSTCGEKQKQSLPAKGHNWGQWVITKNPTCTTAGERVRSCTCGEKQVETINATGHKESSWIVDKEATCSSTGSRHKECTVCGVKTTIETIEKNTNHKYNDGIVKKQPTCTEAGTKEVTCSLCKEKSTIAIPPLGHDFDTNGVCKRCGLATLNLTTQEKTNSRKVATMSSSFYNSSYRGQFDIGISFKDKSGYSLDVPAYVDVRIINSSGAVVYNRTLVLSSSDDEVHVNHSDITPSNGSKGVLYYRVYSPDYFSFAEKSESVSNLPWIANIKLPKVPSTYHYYSYDNSISSSCVVTSITHEMNGTTLTITVTGEKTYDKKGNSQSSSCYIGWKLYDKDGFVVKSGTIHTESIKVGDKFREKVTAYDLEENMEYTLVFSHVN